MASVLPPRRTARRRWLAPLVILAGLALLILDLAPAVPEPAPPSAARVEAVRNAARSARNALRAGNGRATLTATNAQMQQAAGLASRLRGIGRAAATIEDGELRLTLSRRLLGPIWLNGYARVEPSAKGFPPVALRLGRLPLGETVSRWAIGLAVRVARARGVRVPPLDQLVRSARFTNGRAMVAVTLPLQGKFIETLPSLNRTPVDVQAVRFAYCRLVKADRQKPLPDLAALVARAFAPLPGALPAHEQNRARFVALAMYAVGPSSGRLAPGAQHALAACPGTPTPPQLLGREDLARHWALSGALAVSLGEELGRSMGEWKELADSRPNGSGFSFVDLAADRAGLATATRAADPEEAQAMAVRLRNAKEEQLLPVRALAMAEGMSEAAFVSRYRDVDSARFAAAIVRIDHVIGQSIGR